MIKCSINEDSLGKIKAMTARVARNYLKQRRAAELSENELKQQLKSTFEDMIKDIKDYQFEIKDSNVIAELISETASKYGIALELPEYFDITNINNKIISSKQGILLIDTLEASTDLIVNAPLIRALLNASKEFLNKSFGIAREVRIAFEKQMNQKLFDLLFVNRGSATNKLGPVSSTTELNKNIRDFQLSLLLDITDYIKYIKRTAKNWQLGNEATKALLSNRLYDSNNKNTGILDVLSPIIKSHIESSLIGNTDVIRKVYNDSKNNEEAAKRLKAFYASILLNNFDSYLDATLGKIIQIKDPGLKTGEDKYQIAGKTSKLITTWRTSDNIFVEDEADAITKLAINTTPLYKFGSQTPIDGQFINFGHFLHIVAKIKELTFKPEAYKFLFDRSFKKLYPDLYALIPEELQNRSLGTAINYIRKNPLKYTHLIFNILSNPEFRANNLLFYSNFTNDELNKLYSLNKGLFNGTNSIRQLTGSGFNYYSYITQTLDSIFNVNYIQYYNDEKGITKVRTLLDLGINNIRRKIELNINITNSVQLISNWKQYKKLYNFKEIILDDTLKWVTFDINDIKVSVSPSSGTVLTSGYLNYEKAIPFIDKVLKLNLQNSPDFIDNLEETFEGKQTALKKLFDFSARVLMNLYIQGEKLQDMSTKDRIKEINNIYGRNAPSYNYELDEIGMVHGNDIHTLYDIAISKANLDGVTTSTQVKDGEGNALPNQSTSRLLGSFRSLWELQERLDKSASKNLTLLTHPGLLENVFTAKEYYNRTGKSKASTKMSVSEMAYSEILYDFIGGLINRDDNNFVGNGKVMILPSVNSDKSTIGRLLLNLNVKVKTRSGVEKPLKDFRNDELLDLISKDFGEFYTNMLTNIKEDWNTLSLELIKQGHPIGTTLTNGTLDNFESFNTLFPNLNTGYKNPVEFIKAKVLEYNKSHRLKPLELVDLVHYIDNDGNLSFNNSILAEIAKFNPAALDADTISTFPSAQTFWQIKNSEVLKSLLKSDFKLNLETDLLEANWIKEAFPQWVDASGNLILATINIGGQTISITSNNNFYREGVYDINRAIDDNRLNIALNPLLEKYNYLSYFASLEFINLTVGSFIAHPVKGKASDILVEEALRYLAQHKRNVSMTAAMHEFQLNMLNGIPESYNIAVIDDIKDFQGTITHFKNKIKPFDGATFVNPFVVLLENYSLCGAKAGITKKQFVHYKNERTGTGGIIKTAGFGLTNDWIRNSPFLLTMMYKMTHHVWLDENGNLFTTNILRDYNGNKIKYKDIYYKRNGILYKVVDIKKLDATNTYIRYSLPVTIDGNIDGNVETDEMVIDNNYSLWNLFGGKDSMEVVNNKLQPSNTSVENVVIAMNNIGIKKVDNPTTLDDVWQPLKMSDVHYVATAGAVKQGAANINSAEKYTNNEDYDILRIHMYQAGILLDKEHHADDSELSLMTLVISACASKGYTFEVASNLYESLRTITNLNTKEDLDATVELFNTNTPETIANFLEILMKSIVKAIANSRGDSFIKDIANDIMNQAKQGIKIKYSDAAISLSDNTIYRKLFSTISSVLTKTGIKYKIPGLLSVLTPSYGIFKLYAGRKYESFGNPKEELQQIQDNTKPIFDKNDPSTSITDIELGRRYIVKGAKNGIPFEIPFYLQTPYQYQALKKRILQGDVISITENIIDGRDLAGYNVRFLDENGNKYLLWDLNSALAVSRLHDLKESWGNPEHDIPELQSIIKDLYGIDVNVSNNPTYYLELFTTRANKLLQNDLLNLSETKVDINLQFKLFCLQHQKDSDFYKQFVSWVNIKLNRLDGDKLKVNGKEVEVTSDNIGQLVSYFIDIFKKAQKVRIGDNWITPTDIKTSAYEIIMPKTFATNFGLNEFDSIDSILGNKYFFVEQYLKNQTTKVNPNQYTIEFKRSDGNHVYVINKKSIVGSRLTKLNGIITETDEKGTTYRLKLNKDRMYEIPEDAEIYVDSVGNEVIASDNIEHFINNLSYDSIKLSPEIVTLNALHNTLNALKDSNNKKATYFYMYLVSKGMNSYYIMDNNLLFHNTTLDNYKNEDANSFIIKQGLEKHTSFIRSLDIIAARIPAQSMQSYMPMKVVAFDNPDINTAYVSTYQILLQGSDY